MKRLVIVRHAPADWPESREGLGPRYRGWGDAPLGERGLQEARAVAGPLARRYPGISAVYSSDLSRAARTADEIAARTGLTARRDRSFREVNFGEWEGRSHEELQREERYRLWLEDPRATSPPGGETLAECYGRVMEGIKKIGGEVADETVALVGHGGSLRLLICGLLGMPPENHWRIGLDLCGVSVVDFVNETPVLNLLNYRLHPGGS